MFVSLPNYILKLVSNMIIFGDEVYGRGLGHEGTAPMNGINALVKGTLESF